MVQLRQTPDRWILFTDFLRGSVSPSNWQTWLSALDHDRDDEDLVLVVPSEFHLQWIRDKHEGAILAAVGAAYGPDVAVTYRVDEPVPVGDNSAAGPLFPVEPVTAPPVDPPVPASLMGRYRFDSFVVGPSNRFAYAAAMSVAERPGISYNPLFIYGFAGLGKTHLLNAVGHHSRELYPDLSVRYVTSENFLNDFIECIRRKRVDDFKQRYRSVDVLLLDDVQFFEGKEQILEEFAQARVRHFVFDLQNVTYMDSACIGVMVELLTRIQTAGGRIALVNAGQSVSYLFKLTRLDRLFPICRDVMQAIAAVERALSRVAA